MILFKSLLRIIEEVNLLQNGVACFEQPLLIDQNTLSLKEQLHDELNNNGFLFLRPHQNMNIESIYTLLKEVYQAPIPQNLLGKHQLEITPIQGAKSYIHSCKFQPLHTDNGYNHFAPQIIVMHCLQKARRGGESLLVGIHALLAYLKKNYSNIVHLLYQPDAITYIKGHQATSKSIFKIRDNKTEIYLSVFADLIWGISEEAEELFLAIIKFIHNPSHQQRLILEKNDFLIIDNRTMLHGRNAFEGPRLLTRQWYRASCYTQSD